MLLLLKVIILRSVRDRLKWFNRLLLIIVCILHLPLFFHNRLILFTILILIIHLFVRFVFKCAGRELLGVGLDGLEVHGFSILIESFWLRLSFRSWLYLYQKPPLFHTSTGMCQDLTLTNTATPIPIKELKASSQIVSRRRYRHLQYLTILP